MHRDNGPALVFYNSDGQIFVKKWLINDQFYSINGPSAVWYHPNGQKYIERWYFDDDVHRLDGPAEIQYDFNGILTFEDYYLHGVQYSKEKYEAELLRLAQQ
jgi:hypothetical protein